MTGSRKKAETSRPPIAEHEDEHGQTPGAHACDHDAIITAHLREHREMADDHLAKLRALTDRHLAEHHDIAKQDKLSVKAYESLGARHLAERRKLTEQMLEDHRTLAQRHLAEVGALWTRHSRARLHNLSSAKKATGGHAAGGVEM
jgi:hypothetical protein